MADFDKLQSTYYSGYQAVKSGDVVVVWGAGMKGGGERKRRRGHRLRKGRTEQRRLHSPQQRGDQTDVG